MAEESNGDGKRHIPEKQGQEEVWLHGWGEHGYEVSVQAGRILGSVSKDSASSSEVQNQWRATTPEGAA